MSAFWPARRVYWKRHPVATEHADEQCDAQRLKGDPVRSLWPRSYGLENDPTVPVVHLAVGIGKIVRLTP
jgi:hypothetical protein